MMLIIYAHPYPKHSYVNQALLASLDDIDGIKINSLYDRYPDYSINVLTEQAELEQADIIVIQHPLQWFNMPSLLRLWFDKVFEHGWAYGEDGHALRGKKLVWVTTTGGTDAQFALGDYQNFDVLIQPLQKTALFCGMDWVSPFVIHDTFGLDTITLSSKVHAYHQYILSLAQPPTAYGAAND